MTAQLSLSDFHFTILSYQRRIHRFGLSQLPPDLVVVLFWFFLLMKLEKDYV